MRNLRGNLLSSPLPTKKAVMRKLISILFLVLFCAHFAYATEPTVAQLEAIKTKLSAQDCQLWMGGVGHEVENVPVHLVEKVDNAIELLKNISVLDALKVIEIYCRAVK